MKEFPSKIEVSNRPQFREEYLKRTCCYLRRDVYEKILRDTEEDPFDMEEFRRKHEISTDEIVKLVDIVKSELGEKGWNVECCYGSTALFIYSGSRPSGCFPDGF